MSIEDDLPEPVVELLAELKASGTAEDADLLAEFLRKMGLEANSILFERERKRVLAKLPPGALDAYAYADDHEA